MNITIREATNNDLPKIMKLIEGVVNYHHNIDRYYKPFSSYKGLDKYTVDQLKDNKVKMLLAFDDDKLIGRMVGVITKASPYVEPKEIGCIDEAYLEEEYRHKQIGEKLFEQILVWFNEKDVNYIQLSVDARNNIGIDAWHKFGFKDYRIEMRKDL